jgi:ABC-type nitrate/sulfonate/bicarbonate transport system permease component
MRTVWRGSLIPIALILMWEIGAGLGAVPASSVSRPSDLLAAGLAAFADGSLLVATAETFESSLGGLALAACIGIGVGVALGLSPALHGVVGPTLEALRPIPPVTLIPLAMLILGFGLPLEIAIVAFASVWPILIVTIAAVRGIDPQLIEVARVLELPLPRRIQTIIIPATAARIGVGFRIAAGISLVVAITVEIVLNPRGLGFGMIVAQQKLQVDLLYALILWTGFVGLLFNSMVVWIERRFLPRT